MSKALAASFYRVGEANRVASDGRHPKIVFATGGGIAGEKYPARSFREESVGSPLISLAEGTCAGTLYISIMEKWTRINGCLGGLDVAGVYAVRHEPSGRVLFSESSRIAKRLWDQRQRLRLHQHFNDRLQQDYDIDPQSLSYWLVCRCDLPRLRRMIRAHHADEARRRGLGYNCTRHGGRSVLSAG